MPVVSAVIAAVSLGALGGAIVASTAPAEERPEGPMSNEVLLPFELERGMVAYEAYRRACAGIDPKSRERLPDWRELHPEVQNVWVTVADEVCRRFQAIY